MAAIKTQEQLTIAGLIVSAGVVGYISAGLAPYLPVVVAIGILLVTGVIVSKRDSAKVKPLKKPDGG